MREVIKANVVCAYIVHSAEVFIVGVKLLRGKLTLQLYGSPLQF